MLTHRSPTRVLMVEDDDDYALMTRRMLETPPESMRPDESFKSCCVHGEFDVTVAGTLSAATDLLHHNEYDVILLDLVLPDGSNETCVNIIREAAAKTPLVVQSGVDDFSMIERFLQDGVDGSILKGTINHHRKLKTLICQSIESGQMVREAAALRAGQVTNWSGVERRQQERRLGE